MSMKYHKESTSSRSASISLIIGLLVPICECREENVSHCDVAEQHLVFPILY